MNSYSAEYYQKLEALLLKSLEEANEHFDENDREDHEDYNIVKEYIGHNEFGLAWEELLCIFVSKKLNIPESMRISGKIMGLQIDLE